MFLIDRRTKMNENAEEVRVANSLLNMDNVNCTMKEFEMVTADDSVEPPPTSSTQRPPVIVGGVLLKTSSLVLVKTVSEDAVSQVSMLCDELRFQCEEQSKVTQVVLDQFVNLGKESKTEDKGANMMTKLVLARQMRLSRQFPWMLRTLQWVNRRIQIIWIWEPHRGTLRKSQLLIWNELIC